jgi:hypothetical protein
VKKALRFLPLALGVIAALATAYGAYTLANYSWNQIVDYRSPYLTTPLPASRPGVAQTDRLVFVIVDGLTDAQSRKMHALQTLREHGTDLVVTTHQPSLSYPDWTTLLTGAPQQISGVLTNWFDSRVPAETLMDTAAAMKLRVLVAGPSSLTVLFKGDWRGGTIVKDWQPDLGVKGQYLSGPIVREVIAKTKESTPAPELVVVHLPDIDEAGHAYGAASKEYAATADKVDQDLGALVGALQDGRTTFVVASDHGHIATGGHGGWEDVVTKVPVVIAGPGATVGRVSGAQEDVAPTAAALLGIPVPRASIGRIVPSVLTTPSPQALAPAHDERETMVRRYREVVLSGSAGHKVTLIADHGVPDDRLDALMASDTASRLAKERGERMPMALAVAAAALGIVLVIGILSWRALVAAVAGTIGYYLLYNALFFVVHGATWSLSSFNSEDLLRMFFNVRMGEAALATIFAAAIAADIYLALRREPKRPMGEYLPGWLSLGAATVLLILSTLALQVAWYLWQWGASVTWVVPDLMWGFKYDLDLIQATAVGATVLLVPLVTYLVGRYHPLRIRGRHSASADGVVVAAAPDDGSPHRDTAVEAPVTSEGRGPRAAEEPAASGNAEGPSPAGPDATEPGGRDGREAPTSSATTRETSHAGAEPAGSGTVEPEQLRLLDDIEPAKQRNPYESA